VLGAVVEMNTAEDPRTERFFYCSIVSQPVFLDFTTQHRPGAGRRGGVPSSWRKMPEGWRNAFRDRLRDIGLLAPAVPADADSPLKEDDR